MDYKDKYPKKLDFSPGSELHSFVLGKLSSLAQRGIKHAESRSTLWKKLDHTLTAYVDLDAYERLVKQKDPRKPVTIVIPLIYATLETLLTYMVAAFLERPIFKYDSVSDEDVVKAKLLEKVIDLQTIRFKMAINLHTMWRDSLVYGFGPVHCYWDSIYEYRPPDVGVLGRLFGKSTDDMVLSKVFEGNSLFNIDPYNLLCDPNVPVYDVQKAEFVGWVERTSLNFLLEQESIKDSPYFNVKFLRGKQNTSQLFDKNVSGRRSKTNYYQSGSQQDAVDIVNLYVRLIPKEWHIGSGEIPEKWMFVIAGDSTIIAAGPLNLRHNRFPVVIDAPSFDGHSPSPVSLTEVLFGLQHTADWLFKSHITNVRKAINDVLVVDPYLVNYEDVKNPTEGKIIRLKRAAWGKGVKDAVYQLSVADVTRGNIADIQFLISMINMISGAVDQVKGLIHTNSERVSATEAHQTFSSALSRLEKMARLSALTSHQDLAYMLASHTQQFMEEDTFVKITGSDAVDLINTFGESRRRVSPEDIDIPFDIVPNDGSLSSKSDTNAWVSLYAVLAKNPELASQFDMMRIFKHIARATGAKNVDDFIKRKEEVNLVIAPDQQVESQAEAGNIVPVSELESGVQ